VPDALRRTLGEGGTPLVRSAADPRLLLKREDANPTGSHKDRAAAFQLAAAAARGDRAVTISSSGNAAIATSRYAALHEIPAVVFVHPATDPAKLASIDGTTTTLVVTERAINGAKHLARELRIPNLRPSTNAVALVGYASLGEELARELPADIDCVVLFATSGATAIAVADALARLRPGVQVHVVQGEGNAALVDPDAQVTDQSAHGAAAGRLGVRRSRRGRELRAAIEATGGAGHVATAEDVARARGLLAADGIDVSDESAANVAVAQRLADAGHHVCCVISGAPAGASGFAPERIDAADEHAALAATLDRLGPSSR
jgi:threonine synthase